MNITLWTCVLTATALMLAAGLVNSAPVRTGAALEFQTGPVILAFAAPDAPVRVVAEETCLSHGCPLIELRIRTEPAPEAAERVHLTTQ